MKKNLMQVFMVMALFPLVQGIAQTPDFFKIQSVKYVEAPPPGEDDIFSRTPEMERKDGLAVSPYLEVTVSAGERTRAQDVYAKVYYYNKDRVQIGRSDRPTPVLRDFASPYSMPVFFEKDQAETLCFIVPKVVLAAQGWQAVVVFGDKHAAVAAASPPGPVTAYDFPERRQVDNPLFLQREAATNPLVEYVAKTGNAKHPQITLFMRPPFGMTDMSEANGVLAMCVLGHRIEDVKKQLQEVDAKTEVAGVLRFAEERKLVILCWGSRPLWDPQKSWDELSKDSAEQMSDTFDDMAAAWAQGIEHFSRQYGMAKRDFLLWGSSGSAQYAKRLALRKPQYFLAVHLHIPSSFDKPTQNASQLLWCLTTGENESGYDRSLRFLAECRRLGYPIIYKAIPGLAHQGHPAASRLGIAFFDYALSLREEKREYKEAQARRPRLVKDTQDTQPPSPWPASFREPEFFGDVVNQQVFPAREGAAFVPEAFRIDIPTKALADAWGMEN